MPSATTCLFTATAAAIQLRLVQRRLQTLVEQRAIGETCQRVVARLVAQLLALLEVGEHDRQAVGEVGAADAGLRRGRGAAGAADAEESQQPAAVFQWLQFERRGVGDMVVDAGMVGRVAIDQQHGHRPGVQNRGHARQ